MFDGDEVRHMVLLLSDGHEIYAVPVFRMGDTTYEVKQGYAPKKFELKTMAACALAIDGADVPE